MSSKIVHDMKKSSTNRVFLNFLLDFWIKIGYNGCTDAVRRMITFLLALSKPRRKGGLGGYPSLEGNVVGVVNIYRGGQSRII